MEADIFFLVAYVCDRELIGSDEGWRSIFLRWFERIPDEFRHKVSIIAVLYHIPTKLNQTKLNGSYIKIHEYTAFFNILSLTMVWSEVLSAGTSVG